MIERRRRELLDPASTPQPRAAAAIRVAAFCLLAFLCVPAAVGFGITADAAIRAMATPALASIDTTRYPRREAAHAVSRRRTDLPVAPERSSGREYRRVKARPLHRELRARVRRRDPSAAPDVQPSASPSPASSLVASSWRLTADGTWTATVSLPLPPGDDPAKADVRFSSDTADILPLDGRAPGAPGALVTIASGGDPVDVSATPVQPAGLPATVELPAPPADVASFEAVAQTVGPHLVDVGWTPLLPSAGVVDFKIYRRRAGAYHGELIGSVSPGGHGWHDASVTPTTAYTYTVVAALGAGAVSASTGFVATPPIMQPTSLDAISGKGMFLYFVPDAADPNGFPRYDPDAVIERAKTAGISHIELRMARGTFFEGATPDARAWLDSFIDKADAAGIALIAWQVPRRATTDDAAQAVAIARYRTAAGNGFSGLSLDIEDGENYMGLGDAAKQRMVDQIQMVRQAVGPDYLIVATVMSPKLTHWTNARYPYDRIAPYASVLQPMEYWHHFYSSTHHDYTQAEVVSACADSVTLTRSLAGRTVPINVAGQSDDLGSTGPPSGDEIGWCLTGSKSAGAVGQTFFDWRGTGDDAWGAISGFQW